MYNKCLKRILDFLLAIIASIVLSPIYITVAVLVRIKHGNPVLFVQKRPGKNEKIILVYKFRTMTNERAVNGELLPDDKRLTKFGRFLRSSSLDELPELINILKGEMSFVGPRPQLVKDMVFMTPTQRLRHSVRPGLTGLAQVNGRNAISWEEKLQYDLQYLDNITFRGDVCLIFQTIAKVIRRSGINQDGMDTAEDLGDYLVRIKAISEVEYSEKVRVSLQLML